MSTKLSPVERGLAAETRAVENGRVAVIQSDGAFRVKSDTVDGKWYRVAYHGLDRSGFVVFDCVPHGNGAYRDDHGYVVSPEPGVPPCQHAACAARRMERDGWLRWDHGRFVMTNKARTPTDDGSDPFEGLV